MSFTMANQPKELTRLWDVVVIGTGIGGATIGLALARQGKSVLFCEQGGSSVSSSHANRGDYAEMFFPKVTVPDDKHRLILQRSGRWAEMLEDHSGTRTRKHIPFIGSGTGGSSALYGAAMERFFPEDFTPVACHADRYDTEIPEAWPIGYSELAPYYQRAEELYGVKGSRDPLRTDPLDIEIQPAPPLSPANQTLFDFLLSKGLHPYRLPSACEFVPGCQTCQGFLCARNCKNDSVRVCLIPAIQDYGAHLVDHCRVHSLKSNGTRVTSIFCDYRGEAIKLKARRIVLAAGALSTPLILLRSMSQNWPQGLANGSGLVGGNLMRHYIDLYALMLPVKPAAGENLKELAFNDFYFRDGEKLGTVQSFGRLPPASMLVASLQHDIEGVAGHMVAALFGLLKPLLRPLLGRMFENALVLATTLEDLPFRENRVFPVGRDGIAIRYNVYEKDSLRISRFRELMQETLKPLRYQLIKQAENNDRIAHACGTCRMGDNPKSSVVNRDNRAHELDNLYIVDSSFFPSSGGTNPSLTIAANALRVAELLHS